MRSLFGLMSVVCLGLPAWAGQWDALSIEVHSPSGTDTYAVSIANGVLTVDGDRLEWNLSTPVTLVGTGGETIATIASASYAYQFSPRATVEMDFAILSGSQAIEVYADSPILPFPTVPDTLAEARAAVSFALTDGSDGFAEMVSLGMPVGVGAYRGRVNDGQTFTSMIYQMAVQAQPGMPAGTVNANGAFPTIGYAPLGIDVSQLSTDVSFTLTPNDLFIVDAEMGISEPVPGLTCPGDLNANGGVDLGDLTIFLNAYGACATQSSYVPQADLNSDSCITLQDLGELLTLFGDSCQ